MTTLPAAGYFTDPERINSEAKEALDDLRDFMADLLGTTSELPQRAAVQPGDVLVVAAAGSSPWATEQATAAQVRDFIADALSGFALVNGYVDASVAGNALTLAVKTLAGADPSPNDPVLVRFRSATATDGKPVTRSIIAALSIVVPDTATLGTVNFAIPRIWYTFHDDAGTVRLGVINCRDGNGVFALDESALVNSTVIGTTADGARTFFTNGAGVTSKAFRVGGYLEWSAALATAGTWDTGPAINQQFGKGVKLPGDIVQTVFGSAYTTNGNDTTYVPADDTLPTVSEGTQTATCIFTPKSLANGIEFEFYFNGYSTAANTMVGSLFDPGNNNRALAPQDIAANRLASAVARGALPFGNVAAGTWQGRVGGISAVTTYFNGSDSGRLYGGGANHRIVIREIHS